MQNDVYDYTSQGSVAKNTVLQKTYRLLGLSFIPAVAGAFFSAKTGFNIFAMFGSYYVALAAFFGFFYGMYIPSVAGVVGVVFGRKEMPQCWGLISLVGMAGGAGLGPYIAGALRDATGSYFVAIWLAVVFYLLACLFMNVIRQPSREEVWGR
mgnify:CR=1 FL=1